MPKLWKLLWQILWCERGDDDPPASGGGQGDPPAEDPPAGDPPADPPAEGDDPPADPPAPKYGEFGDDPTVDQVVEAYNALKGEHEGLTGKTTATEKNLAALRGGLKNMGIKVLTDDDGNTRFETEEPASEAKKRFTEEHGKLFEPDVLEAMKLLVQDYMDDGFTGYDKRNNEARSFNVEKHNSLVTLSGLYPQLMLNGKDGKPNPTFNQAFYDKATERWKTKYSKAPKGQLFAAHEIAIEMGVSPTAIAAAKKVGAEIGKAQKKVLGPAGGSAQKGGGGGKLSQEQYLALSQEDREKYDKRNLNIKE